MSIRIFVVGGFLGNTVMKNFQGLRTRGSRSFSFNPANRPPPSLLFQNAHLQKISPVILYQSCGGQRNRRKWSAHANNGGGGMRPNIVAIFGIGALTGFLGKHLLSKNEKEQQALQCLKGFSPPIPSEIPPPSKVPKFLTPIPGEAPNSVRRQQEIKNVINSLSNQPHDSKLAIAVIVGPPEIGKSELARQVVDQYIKNKSSPYDYVLWVPCGSDGKEAIWETYAKVYTQLELGRQEMSREWKIQKVKKFLEENSCLLIFDNAFSIEAVASYLPKQGEVLITSRNSCPHHWEGLSLYSLPPLGKDDILSLASKFLENPENKKCFLENLKLYIEFLPHFPLAFEKFLSLSYKCTSGEEKELFKALSIPKPPLTSAQSIQVIGKEILEELQKKPGGEKAIRLLIQLALFGPKDIPFERVPTLNKTDKTPLKNQVRDALSLLEE